MMVHDQLVSFCCCLQNVLELAREEAAAAFQDNHASEL